MNELCHKCGHYHNLEGPCVVTTAARTRDPLLVEREKTHGSWEKTAQLAQDLKRVINKDCGHIPVGQVEALSMICTKIARILSGNSLEPDHWLDIAGYAKLGAEACETKSYDVPLEGHCGQS